MRLLILGGTGWLGAELARAALAAGDEVTCLARGTAGRTPPDGATFVRADRTAPDAYAEVADRDWDAVVDVGSQPGPVRAAAAALAPRTRRVVYVSSISVYADDDAPDQDETAPVHAALTGDAMAGAADYAAAKVACERAWATAVGPQRYVGVRAGLIGGPGDVTGRSTYWPVRMHDPAGPNRSVLVPDAPTLDTQLIDVRDLAAFCHRLLDPAGPTGALDVAGPVRPLGEHLHLAAELATAERPDLAAPTLVPVDPGWLAARDVGYWAGPRSLPLWLPDQGYAGFTRRCDRAHAAGLVTRPLSDTLRDGLAAELAAAGPGGPELRSAGLTAAEERELLARWHDEQAQR